MALSFPLGEAPGQTYTEGGKTWRYDGTKWNRVKKNVSTTEISDAAPSSPQEGQRWINSDTGQLFFYKDGAWVQAMIM